ncbi:conjugal transfer coupling protein traG [Haloferula helveola]|uniref:Conjugal transfer coupling protein traG n=1 Tax=Haloferula helveola TaxID=490095 RepID=A0ABM7R9Z6_9BACT|nr:conjugal transfer coupling protein traG [Haloferula helveola]
MSDAGDEPFWRRLFAPGSFEWAFKMRAGDARSFFAPADPDGRLLRERAERLDRHPERYAGSTEEGRPLIAEMWKLAAGWGQVDAPGDGDAGIHALSRQWEPDLLVMDHAHSSMVAGAVCFPSSWSLRHALGKPVEEIHAFVPQLNPQIGERIRRFLASLSPGKSFRRENWGLTRSGEYDYHPDLGRRRLDESVGLDEVFLRVEHQLFTGIPGGVLMGLRIEVCPLLELSEDREVWSCLSEKLRTMPDDVAGYKGIAAAQRAIVAQMEETGKLS